MSGTAISGCHVGFVMLAGRPVLENPMQIHIEEEAVSLLEKYCKYRPGKPQYIVESALRPWYALGAKMWLKYPNAVPLLPKVPESKTTGISIAKDHAKSFLGTLDKLNKKLNLEINPVCLASWLVKIYCKGWITKMTKDYKHDFGKFKRT